MLKELTPSDTYFPDLGLLMALPDFFSSSSLPSVPLSSASLARRSSSASFNSLINSLENVVNNNELEQQSMVHHRKYPLFTYNLYLGVKVIQNVAQYLLHNVTYVPVKFEVDMSNG